MPGCSYPLTGLACVTRVYTDLAVIELDAGRALVRRMCPGLTLPALQGMTGIALTG